MSAPWVVLGDPQAPADHVLAVLRHARAERVVAVGDYFDYPSDDPAVAGRDGVRVLAHLVAQGAIVLLGNHDACRVMELARMSDARFAEARAAAQAGIDDVAFAARFPEIPTPQIAARDFVTFLEEQRRAVMELLLARRLRLAAVGRLADGREALITHAGVTARELGMLGIARETRAGAIARALNAFLGAAVDRVRPAWERGDPAPLDLRPLHVAGTTGREGGGLLYHRPANRERDASRHGVDVAWEFDPSQPRRFDPRALPRGLVQVCGHTTHTKSWKELAGWIAPGATKADVAIRTLLVGADETVRYHTARVDVPADAAALLMVDAAMRTLAPEAVPLLGLEDASEG